MKSNLITLLSTLLLLITGCESSTTQNDLSYFTNIDDQVAWNSSTMNNIIRVKDAPSGKYVSEIKLGSPYSITFSMQVDDISAKPLKSINAKAMIKVLSPMADPLLVINIIDKNGKSMEWLPLGVDDKNQSVNKWVEVDNRLDLTINNRNSGGNTFKVYVSNGTPAAALVDDISVNFSN